MSNKLPCQKYAKPDENDSLFKFYKSTYVQKQHKSPMSEKWLLEHGCFKLEKAQYLEIKIKMNKLKVVK